MRNVIDSMKSDIAHYQKKVEFCDESIAKLEQTLIEANSERDGHLRYIAELRDAIAVLSPEVEPTRAAA